MATDRVQQHDHDALLQRIEVTLAGDRWEERLSTIDLVQGLLRDLPTERTVEHLIDVLDRLSQDAKWEVRRAVVPVLVEAARPAARSVIERLTGDGNRWVRQAAERARRKLARVTSAAEKHDKRARFAFDTIKDLDGKSREKIYEAALLVGEQHYEELAGDTAHELNTFRTSLEGLLQELEFRLGCGNGASPDVGEILDRIRDRSRYLKTLVNGLLDYSKDADLDFQLHQLQPMITEALELARERARARLADREVEEAVSISAGLEAEVCKDRLMQALVNILSNAFESFAGKEYGARVEVGVQPGGVDTVFITIADTGAGMDAAQVANATKRFRSLKKEQGGIGLGLPLALKIIEREHGGQMDISSTVGVGTTVTIELPVRREGP